MQPGKTDLDREILKPLVDRGKVYAYDSPEYIKDMGTPERYQVVCRDFSTGRVQAKNLKKPQKAVFLDRDGTLNVYKGFIADYRELELIDGVAQAVKTINESGYLAIVITNQPVIARGECTFAQLQQINNKLETELGLNGAYVDDIFCCPHHPDKGFPGERSEYKIECDCRKPKPGLLLRAAKKYNIDLSASYMVGDSLRDVQAGKNAGCTGVYLGDEPIAEECLRFASLNDFVKQCISGN
jgi:D-glycero-D-manno-heptose 1,7-bisphosphate phosphatase